MQRRRMIASMMEIMVKNIMKNHCYQFDGKLYQQQAGAPIGLKLSGILARLVMLKFDKLYIEKLRNLKIDIVLYQRYIDDLNMALSCLAPGMRYLNWLKVTKKSVETSEQLG